MYSITVAGVSSNPCSEIYLGPEPFSEPESQNLRDFLATLNNLDVYLSFHSYGQYFLFPWGYGRDYAPNHDDMVSGLFLLAVVGATSICIYCIVESFNNFNILAFGFQIDISYVGWLILCTIIPKYYQFC